AVKTRDQPVHLRVGGKPGLQGEDVWGQVAVTIVNGVEARAGTKQGKPGCPDMGRHQESLRCLLQEDLQQVAAVEAEDRPAVRPYIADGGELRVDPFGRGKIRDVEKIMDLPDPAVTLVDAAYLGGQEEADRANRQRHPRQG